MYIIGVIWLHAQTFDIRYCFNVVENVYLATGAFLLNGSNLTYTLFTGLRFNRNACFLIALTKPDDLVFEPENGRDIIECTL